MKENKDYLLTVSIKNNLLLSMMKAQMHTVLLLIEEKYEWTGKDIAILEAVMGAMSDE